MAYIQSGADTTLLNLVSGGFSATNYGTDGKQGTNVSKNTMIHSTGFYSPGTAPTDVWLLNGEIGKIVELLSINLTCTQTTAGVNSWFIIKRSAANTGGTSTIARGSPKDNIQGVSRALVNIYTANPTPGAAVGTVWSGKINCPAPGTAGIQPQQSAGFTINFLDIFGQPLTLNGIAEGIALNFNGASLPTGLSICVASQWTSE